MSAFLQDIRRHLDKGENLSFKRGARIFISDYGIQALCGYRLGRFLLRAGKKAYLWPLLPVGWPLYYLISRYVRLSFGIHLHLSADIGPGLYIGHFGGIALWRCRLGELCSISQSDQIRPEGNGPGPTLGDRVWVGAHVRIVGAHQIGSRSTISAAAVVQRDIPENTLCMGNPARVVMRDYDNTSILNI